MIASGQTRPRRPSPRFAYARPVLPSKRTPAGREPWAKTRRQPPSGRTGIRCSFDRELPAGDVLKSRDQRVARVAPGDDLLGRGAVGLPGQGGSYTNAERDQKAREGARGFLAGRRLPGCEPVIF